MSRFRKNVRFRKKQLHEHEQQHRTSTRDKRTANCLRPFGGGGDEMGRSRVRGGVAGGPGDRAMAAKDKRHRIYQNTTIADRSSDERRVSDLNMKQSCHAVTINRRRAPRLPEDSKKRHTIKSGNNQRGKRPQARLTGE